jgi:hypothetical protein
LTPPSNVGNIRTLINRTTDIQRPEMNLLNHTTNKHLRANACMHGLGPRMFAYAQERFVSGSMVTG